MAQFNLAETYAHGQGIPKNDRKAREWYERAAAQGDADAQFSMGIIYEEGRGVPKDDIRSYAWLSVAAALGHDSARAKLSELEPVMSESTRAEGQGIAAEIFASLKR